MPKAVTRHQASDGSLHDSPEQARGHEAGLHVKAIVGLTEEDIAAMLAGKLPGKAASVEFVGNRLAEARRREAGPKRTRKAA
jgi:hypothetical protein